MGSDKHKQEAVVICASTIAATAKKLGLAQHHLKSHRCEDEIGQLEKVNELKAKLFNLENRLEELYGVLNDANISLDDELYDKVEQTLVIAAL